MIEMSHQVAKPITMAPGNTWAIKAPNLKYGGKSRAITHLMIEMSHHVAKPINMAPGITWPMKDPIFFSRTNLIFENDS
jgi:hypothetical protein